MGKFWSDAGGINAQRTLRIEDAIVDQCLVDTGRKFLGRYQDQSVEVEIWELETPVWTEKMAFPDCGSRAS